LRLTLTAWENRNILDYRKRNIHILHYFFHFDISYLDYLFLLTGFRRLYYRLLNFHFVLYDFDNLGRSWWRWWRWSLYLFGHRNFFIQSILNVHGIIVICFIVI